MNSLKIQNPEVFTTNIVITKIGTERLSLKKWNYNVEHNICGGDLTY